MRSSNPRDARIAARDPTQMKLSPRNLIHLIALAEEGRISRAALRVHLSPSAFSRSIQSVEDDLGLKLFNRNKTGVSLTAAGEAILGHARALDFENKRFELNLDLLRRGDFDEVRIGAGPIPASIIIPELMRSMHQQAPHLQIHVEFGNMSVLIDRLDQNEIDICLGDIRYVAANEERYASRKLAITKVVVCCRSGHPLSATGRVTSRDLRTHRLALSRVSPAIDRELHACFGLEVSERIPMVVECDDLGVLAKLVATTDLISILPAQVFEQFSGSLGALEPDDPSSLYTYVHAIWPKNRILGPSAMKVLDLARKIAQD
jgi:DNA-binding transcriptional LysR family regulator